jgi:hypothetical protein
MSCIDELLRKAGINLAKILITGKIYRISLNISYYSSNIIRTLSFENKGTFSSLLGLCT